MTQLERLLKEVDDFQKLDDVNDDLFDKVKGELLPNSKVKIYFKNRRKTDVGYVFVLPHQHIDEFDACIHIPSMDNSDGMDNGHEIYAHIYSIVKVEDVVKIVATGGILV